MSTTPSKTNLQKGQKRRTSSSRSREVSPVPSLIQSEELHPDVSGNPKKRLRRFSEVSTNSSRHTMKLRNKDGIKGDDGDVETEVLEHEKEPRKFFKSKGKENKAEGGMSVSEKSSTRGLRRGRAAGQLPPLRKQEQAISKPPMARRGRPLGSRSAKTNPPPPKSTTTKEIIQIVPEKKVLDEDTRMSYLRFAKRCIDAILSGVEIDVNELPSKKLKKTERPLVTYEISLQMSDDDMDFDVDNGGEEEHFFTVVPQSGSSHLKETSTLEIKPLAPLKPKNTNVKSHQDLLLLPKKRTLPLTPSSEETGREMSDEENYRLAHSRQSPSSDTSHHADAKVAKGYSGNEKWQDSSKIEKTIWTERFDTLRARLNVDSDFEISEDELLELERLRDHETD